MVRIIKLLNGEVEKTGDLEKRGENLLQRNKRFESWAPRFKNNYQDVTSAFLPAGRQVLPTYLLFLSHLPAIVLSENSLLTPLF
jgi:hypothetical protein